MTRGAFKAATLPRHPVDATHAVKAAGSDSRRGPFIFFWLAEWWCWRWGSVPRWGLRWIGPALAGNVGAGWAFALSREGDQDVDVPMLAPDRSRCRFVDWGYVPLWGGLMVAVEENNRR